MDTTLVLLASSLAAFIAAWVFSRFQKKWEDLKDFRGNSVGSHHAVCAHADYVRAVKNHSLIERPGKDPLVVVPETIVFFDTDYPSRFSGNSDTYKWLYACDCRPATELFVPFTSNKWMDLEKQYKTFIKPQDPREFRKEKMALNCKQHFQFRFGDWIDRYHAVTNANICGFILFITFVSFAVSTMNDDNLQSPLSVHLTKPNGPVRTITAVGEEKRKLLMHQEYGMRIYKGAVTEVQELGGGVNYVCAKVGLIIHCGVTAGTTAKDEIVYIRTGELLVWHEKDYANSHHSNIGWIITQDEASALLATGKFNLAE